MSDPWVPPYMGSYQELVNFVLTHPYGLAGEPGRPSTWEMMAVRPGIGPPPVPWMAFGPSPSPWLAAVSILVQAVNVKQIAASLPEGDLRTQLDARADDSIDRVLDDWCGTRPPWPWPGPPPWVIGIASQLTAVANSVQSGFVREELIRIAGRALEKSAG
jgi:hypothetical protein